MRRLTRALIRLYPASWRERYGAEFHALMEDVPADWQTNLDLLKGVIRMQFSLPSFTRVALVLSGVGMLAGLALSFAVSPQYRSTSVLMYQDSRPGSLPQEIVQALIQSEGRILSRTSLANIIQQPNLNLYPGERRRKPIDDVIEAMRSDLRLTLRPGGRNPLFTIEFTYPDQLKVQAVNQEVVSRFFQEENLRKAGDAPPQASDIARRIEALEQRIAVLEGHPQLKERQVNTSVGPMTVRTFDVMPSTALDPERSVFAPPSGQMPPDPVKLEVIDPPSYGRPVSPNRAAFALAGLAAGLIAAFIVVIFRRGQRRFNPLPDAVA